MYKHILIATCGSEIAKRAVDQGLALAKQLDCKATALVVTEPFRADETRDAACTVQDYENAINSLARHCLDQVSETAKALGVDCAVEHIHDSDPADGIVAFARTKGCDLIAMSTHGRHALTRLLLRSPALDVIKNSKIPVFVCR